LINQQQFQVVLGKDYKLCEKTAQFDGNIFIRNNSILIPFLFSLIKAKKYAEVSQAQAKPAAKTTTEAPKGDKKKEQAAKPAEKKEKPAPEVDDGDEADDALANEPKQKDPFAEMPKTSFNMDEFKRVYSNEDTVTKAIPYFWNHYDKDNLSIWLCEYKYPEDLTQVFMTCNLVSGMFQRLEKLRKNAFASMCVYGENNNNTIAGLWFWRGQGLAFELASDWQVDYESYSWKKLSPDDEQTKQLVSQFFTWEGDFNGKKFNQGKIFK